MKYQITVIFFAFLNLISFAQAVKLSLVKIDAKPPFYYSLEKSTKIDSGNLTDFVLPTNDLKWQLYKLSFNSFVKNATLLQCKKYEQYILFATDKDNAYFLLDYDNDRNFIDEKLYKEPLSKLSVGHDSLFQFSFIGNKYIQYRESLLEIPAIFYFKAFSRNGEISFKFWSNVFRRGVIKVDKINYIIAIHTTDAFTNSGTKIYVARKGESLDVLRRMSFSIGDTVVLGNKGLILQSVSASGSVIIAKQINLTNPVYGYNVGYHYKPIEVSDFFSKKQISTNVNSRTEKFTIIDFWGTWCTPCLEVIPEIKRIVAPYIGTNIQLVSVAAEAAIDSVRVAEFVKKYQMNWNHVVYQRGSARADVNSLLNQFKIDSYPTLVILSPNGKVIFRGIGTNEIPEFGKTIKNIFDIKSY